MDKLTRLDEPPLAYKLQTHDFAATVDVTLIRDPAGEENKFIDAGSTYTMNLKDHTEHEIGVDPNACLGEADWVSDPTLAQPTAFRSPSSISAELQPFLNSLLLYVDLHYDMTETRNDCETPGGFTQVIPTGGALGCGSFIVIGLSGKLVDNPSGPDTVDMTCTTGVSPDAGVTVSGALTLAD